MAIRHPAVAGSFYPGNPARLASTVDALLAAAPRSPLPPPKALLLPHAGYVYSGPTAAAGYMALGDAASRIRRVVLLGPTHRVAVAGLALPESERFATPLGPVAIDQAAVEALADLPQVVRSERAHAQEHSLEVHLPFLQRRLGHDFTLLPLAVGHAAPEAVAAVIERLWGGPETLIVVSSDLSHFLPYPTAQQTDRDTCRHILDLDAHLQPEQACGAYPVNGLLLVARRRGLQPRLLELCNSGDTAGDRKRVVGYAAIAFDEAAHVVH